MQNKSIELRQQVDDLSTSMTLVTEKTNTVVDTVRTIEESTPPLASRVHEIPRLVSKTERVYEALPPQCKRTCLIPGQPHCIQCWLPLH